LKNNTLQSILSMKKIINISLGLVFLLIIVPSRLSYSTVVPKEYGTMKLNRPVSQVTNLSRGNYNVRPDYKSIVFSKSKEYGMDWQLIMAIIQQESKFDENAVSEKGAQGLMQLMPNTQMDIAENLDNSFNPHGNIDIGINYFSRLYRLFESSTREDQVSLALAAYNAGPSRIYDAQDIAAYLGENPFSWRAIQNALPLLSKRYNTLHQSIWDGGKPRNGYFGSWRQTILYVKSINKYRNHTNLTTILNPAL
jgi:membrane-bound lytic murein transglycosylase MltF